jgi:hypothetical protein
LKKSIAILFFITAIACSKNTGTSKFAGTWSGTYSSAMTLINPPVFDTGTVQIAVGANNSATGTLQSLHGGTQIIMKGTVDPSSGSISLFEYGVGNYGANIFLEGLNGNLSADQGGGNLTFPWATTSRWWATKN